MRPRPPAATPCTDHPHDTPRGETPMTAQRTGTSTTSQPPAPMTAAQASCYQRLRGHLATLKLHDAAEALPAVLDHATAEGLTLTAALERLLSIEVTATDARRLAGRLRFACLPSPATVDNFDYDAAPAADRALIGELATCRYLDTATNVLLIGPPGTGKTHLAVALARAAAEAGYRTYFTTAADLAARCHRAAIEGRWPPRSASSPDPPCSSSTNSVPPTPRRSRLLTVPRRLPALPQDVAIGQSHTDLRAEHERVAAS